jgi:hypothetical protein
MRWPGSMHSSASTNSYFIRKRNRRNKERKETKNNEIYTEKNWVYRAQMADVVPLWRDVLVVQGQNGRKHLRIVIALVDEK